jgi:hypothetical protein
MTSRTKLVKLEFHRLLEGVETVILQAFPSPIAVPQNMWPAEHWIPYAERERWPGSFLEFDILAEEDACIALPFLGASFRWAAGQKEDYCDIASQSLLKTVTWHEAELISLGIQADVHRLLALLPWMWFEAYGSVSQESLQHIKECDARNGGRKGTWFAYALETGEDVYDFLETIVGKEVQYEYSGFQTIFAATWSLMIELPNDPWVSGALLDVCLRVGTHILDARTSEGASDLPYYRTLCRHPLVLALLREAHILGRHWENCQDLMGAKLPSEYVRAMQCFLAGAGVATINSPGNWVEKI